MNPTNLTMNLNDLTPDEQQVVLHASALVDRGIGMIDAYFHEHELDKVLSQESAEKVLYCTYIGLFMVYLRQIFHLNGEEGVKIFMDTLTEKSLETIKEI